MACCSLPADVLWGSFVKHSFLHEWVTNEPQRTSAGRLGLLESLFKHQVTTRDLRCPSLSEGFWLYPISMLSAMCLNDMWHQSLLYKPLLHVFRDSSWCTNYDWHHSYCAEFSDPFQLPFQVLVVFKFLLPLCLSFVCQTDKQHQ